MINKEVIELTLQDLENLYNSAMTNDADQKILIFYSKLATLELCGWIEESLDDIVLRYADTKLTQEKNTEDFKKIVKDNFGFDYNKNFRKMLMSLIGLISIEKLESNLQERDFLDLKSQLGSLKTIRNSFAHTHINPHINQIEVTRTYYAPSITKRTFQKVYRLLTVIETELGRL